MSDEDVLLVERVPVVDGDDDGGVIVIATINRPDKLNALSLEVMERIKEFCTQVENDESIRTVIFTGAPPREPEEGRRQKPNAFIAGFDITVFVGKGSEEIRPLFKDNGWETIWNLSKPTIAMIDGFALGGGCEVACSCDIRIASNRSRIGTPEISLGLIPGGGGTQRLVNLIGYGRAMEMVMSGEMVSADRAHEMGLLNHVCEAEELKEKTLQIARVIAGRSMHTLRIAKNTVRAALDTGISEGISIEAEAFAGLFDSEDKEIGVSAFLERATPEWKDC